MKPSRLWAASLGAVLVIVVASAASATSATTFTAPADNVTIEILESNSDFVNRISLWGPSVDLTATDDDTGATRTIERPHWSQDQVADHAIRCDEHGHGRRSVAIGSG